MNNLYLLINNTVSGPFSIDSIKEMLAVGAIGDDTLIAAEGSANWEPLLEVLRDEAPAKVAEIDPYRFRKLDLRRNAIKGGAVLLGLIILTVIIFERGPFARKSSQSDQPMRKQNNGVGKLSVEAPITVNPEILLREKIEIETEFNSSFGEKFFPFRRLNLDTNYDEMLEFVQNFIGVASAMTDLDPQHRNVHRAVTGLRNRMIQYRRQYSLLNRTESGDVKTDKHSAPEQTK